MSLSFTSHGTGTPVVLLHGLTFDRRSWRPIVDRLGDDVHTIAIDLPAHGESGGSPCTRDEVADQVHQLVEELGLDRPVVVGHSMAGAVAMIYAARYPARAAVDIDAELDIRPFAALVRQLEPALRGPAFEQAFEPFQRSIGLQLVGEPVPQEIRQDVVVGYWEELMRTEPDAMQRRIEGIAGAIDVPCLILFGHALTEPERDYIGAQVPTAEVEEWDGDGHCLHLVEPDRFAARLRRFVEECSTVQAV